jgi:hypothetical protein
VHAWQRRLATAPLPVHFVMQAVLFGVGIYLLGPVLGQRSHSWIRYTVAALLFGLATTAGLAWQRRRNGGVETILAVSQAIRHEGLPPDADPREWLELLEREERTHRRAQVTAAIVFPLLAVLCAWLALAVSPRYWIHAASLAVVGVIGTASSARNLRRVERLLDRLAAGSPAG